MFNYHTTSLEDDLRSLYHHLNITEPFQLDMAEIASKLNIWIYFQNTGSMAMNRRGLHSIIIDRRLSSSEQWQDFAHELCHLLRQCGNQLQLPESFVRFQEEKADNFAYEFCVPTFMLLNLSLPQQRNEAIKVVADTFNVQLAFADKRLALLERRLFNTQATMHIAAAIEAEYHFKKGIGCDYVFESKDGTAYYSFNKGLLGVRTNTSEDEG